MSTFFKFKYENANKIKINLIRPCNERATKSCETIPVMARIKKSPILRSDSSGFRLPLQKCQILFFRERTLREVPGTRIEVKLEPIIKRI
jgi:hypothetical protein